jgi:hypothetical protein
MNRGSGKVATVGPAKKSKGQQKVAARPVQAKRSTKEPTSNVVKLQQPRDLMLAKLKESGLDRYTSKLQVKALNKVEAQQELEEATAYPFPAGMKLPYLDAKGQDTGFFRVRGLGTVPPSAFGGVKEPPKYKQRAGSLNRAYLAPTLERPWSEVVADPEVEVIITEGELKAAKACAEGFTTIGLGGVDTWSAKGRGLPLLPDLAEWEWNNRRVTVLYDADIAEKPEVRSAQDRLARSLTGLGAVVSLANLPPDGPKGMDDFLMAKGAAALRVVLEDAEPYEHGRALREMNDLIVYVAYPGVVVVRKDGQPVAIEAGKSHRFADLRHFVARGEGGLKEVSTFEEWVRWRGRLRCECLAYEPGHGEFVGTAYNTWRPSGCEPKEGDVRPFHTLMDHIFQGADQAHRKWLERWLAYPLQQPGAKLYTAVVLWSHAKGVGKDLLAETLARVYGANFGKVGELALAGQFTGWLKQKQFVYGEEITGSDSRAHANRLKGLITSETVTINEKFLPEYTVRNTVNFFFSSNHPDAFRIENRDRRYFIHEVTAQQMPKELGLSIRAWKNSPDGPSALLHYLLNLDLGDFEPTAPPPMTAAKEAMTYDAESDLGQWVMDLVKEPTATLSESPFFKGAIASECDLFTTKELLAIFDDARGSASGRPMTLKTMGLKLKEHGLRLCGGPSGVVRVGGGIAKLYAIRNPEKWLKASSKEVAAHRLKFFPGGEAHGSPQKSKY